MYAAFARTMPVALPDADGELRKFFAVATTAPQGLRAGAPPDGLTVWHGTRTCRRHREDPMLQCPACGQALDDEEVAGLDVAEELECSRCQRTWLVAGLQPLRLESNEQELAFTD
jgi:hypothetical protein